MMLKQKKRKYFTSKQKTNTSKSVLDEQSTRPLLLLICTLYQSTNFKQKELIL